MVGKLVARSLMRTVDLWVRNDICALIDRAATVHGKRRSDFMIDAARRAAEDALLARTLVRVDQNTCDQFLAVLDWPPSGDGFQRLMTTRRPWES